MLGRGGGEWISGISRVLHSTGARALNVSKVGLDTETPGKGCRAWENCSCGNGGTNTSVGAVLEVGMSAQREAPWPLQAPVRQIHASML